MFPFTINLNFSDCRYVTYPENIKLSPPTKFYTEKLERLFNSDKFTTHPYFGDTETDITVQQGEAAFFNCHVFNLANQTVSLPFSNVKSRVAHVKV